MPWKVSGVMEQRREFLRQYERGEQTMTELCRAYGITRPTGYAIWHRYERAVESGLEDRSRATHRHPNQTPSALEEAVLGQRQAHMRWGPRKLKAYLERTRTEQTWPAASTFGEMLQRAGAPNRLWCADFKGRIAFSTIGC